MIGRLPPRLTGTLAWALTALTLAGCVTVLPKATPVQLYGFGGAGEAVAARADAVEVALSAPTFARASQGDLILTRTGDEMAYVGGARWVAPATVLFQEDALNVFMSKTRGVRLRAPGEIGHVRAGLHMSVRDFEARYEGKGAPVVVVTVVARLAGRGPDAATVEKVIHVEQRASENRISAIVRAFDAATNDALEQVADFTEANIQHVTN